ncbi:efflux RND transporter periplasmic adaptor subunit [Alicyclobacillus dauci]|uniref:Efflux RND transporter periplasmic adaptor subunit n=1 Tax=Alicyclobacillus dauci TaxID=1475485 RepID=A0ABY6Z6G3_9BACL|nr:efflux RND transporter periplasmic adaptor subunit [Alicyclobacillus dauci]WAH38197.1 efflux RND transporter periplasmic adaptor subunit [Alicyclobacillus dauci]
MQRERASRRKRVGLILLISVIILLAIAAGLFVILENRNRVPRVQTTTVQLKTMQRVIFSSGPVKPTDRQLVYATSLPSPVKKLNVSVGDHVKTGQVLAELDDTAQQSALQAAQSALSEANSAYARALQGYDQAPSLLREVWLPQVTSAQSAVASAKQQVATAQAQLSATKIRATMTGTVLIASADGIDATGTQTPVIEVVGSGKKVILELSEVDATHVQEGMKVSMTSEAFPNETFHGKVSLVAPYAQITQAGTGQVEVDVTPSGNFSVPFGYQMDCKVSSATHKAVPTVPYGALVQQGTNYAVYVVKQGHVHLVSVQLGITNDTSVEVTSGLRTGEIVVDNPPGNLIDGEAVSTG